MEATVPWDSFLALIQPAYYKPTAKGGRPPFLQEVMLRIHLLQQWFTLSDPLMEEMLIDTPCPRRFAGIDMIEGRIPDETTIGAEVLIAIKGSRRKAFQLICDRPTYGKRLPFQAKVCECGHGRESTWILQAMEAPEWVKEIWPGSALIITVRSVGTREGRPIKETHYYVTSLLTTE